MVNPIGRLGRLAQKAELHTSLPPYAVGLSGAGGRLGTQLQSVLKAKGVDVVPVERQKLSATRNISQLVGRGLILPDQKERKIYASSGSSVEEWTAQLSGLKVFVNAAVMPSGTFEDMMQVNVDMPKNIAEACKNLGIHMVHLCSAGAQLPGLNKEDHPYAKSKQMAAEALSDYDNVTILRIGAVVGSQSSVPVCSDAAVAPWSPFVVLPPGGGNLYLYPIDEHTVLETVTKVVDRLTVFSDKEKSLPNVIDVAGHPICLEDFLKRINTNAVVSVRIPKIALNALNKIVNKGVFTPEFSKIAELVHNFGPACQEPDRSGMERLGVPIPSTEKVVLAARKQLNFLGTTVSILSSAMEKLRSQQKRV